MKGEKRRCAPRDPSGGVELHLKRAPANHYHRAPAMVTAATIPLTLRGYARRLSRVVTSQAAVRTNAMCWPP